MVRILMRLLTGAGTPKEAARGTLLPLVVPMAETGLIVILAIDESDVGILVVIVSADLA